MYDPDNFEVDDDDNININKNSNIENEDDEENKEDNSINSLNFGNNRETSNKKRRFIEVLSGTEDPLLLNQ